MVLSDEILGFKTAGVRKTIEHDYPTGEMMALNMGPQHPSTHGVLRLVIDIEGETVKNIKPVIGYLHSAKEKLAEAKTYHKFIPYTDRLDYISPMANNTITSPASV